MTEPHSQDETPLLPPKELVESTLQYVTERLRDRPELALEVRELLAAKPRAAEQPDASLANTIAVGIGSNPTPRAAESSPHGRGRFGDYELIQELARGGMGVVFQARQVSLDRIVALKMILSGQLATVDDVRRFRTEAQAAANLDHPGIVPIYEIGEYAGQHFYSMGFIEGHSLADELREGPIEPRKAARYTQKVAEAIAFAHQRGVIHRDLKPGNVLVDASGEPKVTDFGLAKRINNDSELTGTGQILGTPAFMPPEQASGQVERVKETADVYSLGAMLFCLVTGRPPFQAANPVDTLLQVIGKDPISPRQIDSSIPKDLDTICLKCLQKEPVQRYASARDLADDLGRWLAGEPIHARPVRSVEKAWLWCKRKPMIAGLTAAIIIGAVLGSVVLWERLNAAAATGLVDALASAEPREVPRIISDLEGVSWWAEPRLQQQLSVEGDSLGLRRLRMHARMALAKEDPALTSKLVEDLLAADLRDVANLRDALSRCPQSQVDLLWKVFRGTVEDTKPNDDHRFRAGLALVGLDTSNKDWQSADHRYLVDRLLTTNPVFQPVVWDLLRPHRESLADPLEAASIDSTRRDIERLGAASAVADLVADDTPRLANVLTYATADQFEVLYRLVAPRITPEIVNTLAEISARLPTDDLGSLERIAFGQRRANAAVTLLRLGELEKVLSVFDWTDDPEALSQFIFRCRERGVGVDALLDCLQLVSAAPKDRYPKDTRYALLLALGEFKLEEIPEARRETLLTQLADWYANDPSSGVHGATGWLLREWDQDAVVTKVDQTPVPYSPAREWFTLAIDVQPEKPEGVLSFLQTAPATKTFYYTFIVFSPGDYEIGSVEDELNRLKANEARHSVTLTRPFALLDREVTFEELIAFSPEYAGLMRQFDSKPIDAGFGIDWYDSVIFCRWLSKALGLPESEQCYADPETLDRKKYPRDSQSDWAPKNWPLELNRSGFRLPTESEWEVVARSGSRTAYGFGSDVALLNRFGWFNENSDGHVHVSRELRPSLRGLFDLHGNLHEWTHDWSGFYEESAQVDPLGVDVGSDRIARGGSWDSGAAVCRAALRKIGPPARRSSDGGIRPALDPSRLADRVPRAQLQSQEEGRKDTNSEGASTEQQPRMP